PRDGVVRFDHSFADPNVPGQLPGKGAGPALFADGDGSYRDGGTLQQSGWRRVEWRTARRISLVAGGVRRGAGFREFLSGPLPDRAHSPRRGRAPAAGPALREG